jgi:indole-3-glycerol phosphate synthase
MILDDIVAAKKKRLVRHKENVSEQDMKNLALNEKRVPISFYNALRKQGLSIIGEFKKASPSHGKMNNKIELTDRIIMRLMQYHVSLKKIIFSEILIILNR